jgi:hypothetical protein
MNSSRKVKVFYFESDKNITSYILNLKNIRNHENSMEYRGNHIQLRDVEERENCIVGRICKIREVEKPMTGTAYEIEEDYLDADIIESSNFIYNKNNFQIVIQNNPHVSSNPNSLLSKLIVKTHKDNLNGLGIKAIIRDDVLEELVSNRGSITQVKVKTTKEGANFIARENGDDVEMNDNFLDGASYKERTLTYKIDIGSISESFITKFYEFFNSKKVLDASFTIDGNRSPIKLSEFAKYESLEVEINNGSFDTLDFQNKLLQLMSSDET